MESIGDKQDTPIQENPLSFIRSGYYNDNFGEIRYRKERGYYWEPNPYSAIDARGLGFYSTHLYPQNNTNKGYGYVLRCLSASPTAKGNSML